MHAALGPDFELEVFSSKAGYERRLADFLSVYTQFSPPQHRTPTNQLIDFLERPEAGRDLYYFGLTHEGAPCGFAVLMYYPAHLVGVIDHIVIKPTARGYGAFFDFTNRIATYLERHGITFDYLLAEVLLAAGPTAVAMDPLLLVRAIRFVGFRTLIIPYTAPDPEILTSKSRCQARVLVFPQPARESLPASEVKRVLRVVFFDHYFNWHKRYLSAANADAYHAALTSEFEHLSRRADELGDVKLNGGQNMELVPSLDAPKAATFNLVAYIWFLAIPAVISIVVALAQAPIVTGISLVAGSAIVALAFFHAGFRRRISEFFRLGR